jgi:hypothetical protein
MCRHRKTEFGNPHGEPTADIKAFIERIETVDPNAEDLSSDNTNESWGHYQFTGSHLTCSVLSSWNDVGGIPIACRLIAAAIKTCKVARHLCFKRNIKSTSYLSDIYLSRISGTFWQLWIDAMPVSN